MYQIQRNICMFEEIFLVYSKKTKTCFWNIRSLGFDNLTLITSLPHGFAFCIFPKAGQLCKRFPLLPHQMEPAVHEFSCVS